MSMESSFDNNHPKKPKTEYLNYRETFRLSCKWIGAVDAKLEKAAPYYFFLTRIEDSLETFDEDLTITLPELFDKSLGKLEHSLHINFMVELPWLLAQYTIHDIINPSMTILYGVEDDGLRNIPSQLNVTAIKVKSPYAFGHHHTKMSILFYSDKSVRFAVYTANLVESDWENRTQGIWISPKCPHLGENVPINYGESDTLFKVDVIRYLNSYHLVELKNWLMRIQQTDCSKIKVCFVASIPGDHRNDSYGYKKLSKVIKENSLGCASSSWNLVAQCSSIGSLGPTPQSWLCGEFARSLQINTTTGSPHVNIIYPSLENVRQSHDGMLGGACLPYSSSTHKRQLWIIQYLMQWKSDHRYRSKAVPHIKTYTKISPDGNKVAWFLLTSANLSKAAWGRTLNSGNLRILSYEAGVLFLPKFLCDRDTFTIKKGGYSNPQGDGFPLPYDAPLTSYRPNDKAFLNDKCFSC